VTLSARVDIAVAGAGHTAFTAALALARALPRRRIGLLCGVRPAGESDPRVTALSASSREIFAQLGLWPELVARSEPISDICVSERRAPVRARLGPAAGMPFGHVIENRDLAACLSDAVTGLANVECLPAVAGGPRFRPEGCAVPLAGGEIETRLLVIADGADSPLREHLGIAVDARDYGVSALLATVVLAEPHFGLAHEHFTHDGPLALLPLPVRAGRERAALVWVLPRDRAGDLVAAAPGRGLAALRAALPSGAVALVEMSPAAAVPLRRILAAEQVRSRVVVAGNAAHGLHPVAGQGFNLTVRDLAALAERLRVAGGDPGALPTLLEYARSREADQRRTLYFSEWLPALFASRALPVRLGRQLGLLGVDLVPPLRRALTDFGAGLRVPAARVVADARL
jgi:ubiquinone biosynthesis UbiH/UbiF/VisC/COQ6 family hydroxylase